MNAVASLCSCAPRAGVCYYPPTVKAASLCHQTCHHSPSSKSAEVLLKLSSTLKGKQALGMYYCLETEKGRKEGSQTDRQTERKKKREVKCKRKGL